MLSVKSQNYNGFDTSCCFWLSGVWSRPRSVDARRSITSLFNQMFLLLSNAHIDNICKRFLFIYRKNLYSQVKCQIWKAWFSILHSFALNLYRICEKNHLFCDDIICPLVIPSKSFFFCVICTLFFVFIISSYP